jgi:hypothetical protein
MVERALDSHRLDHLNNQRVVGFHLAVVAICSFSFCYVTVTSKTALAGQGDIRRPRSYSCPANAIRLDAGTFWQAAVSRAPLGAAFCVKSGMHRAQTVLPKDSQRFIGEPGAVMNGTVIISNAKWTGSYWSAAGPKWDPDVRGLCVDTRPMCNDPTGLFVDGKPLEQVGRLDALRVGTFYRDRITRAFSFMDDPRGKTIEATAAAFAFMPNKAKNVVIKGLVVEKYGNPAQLGAIYADADTAASGWLIEDNEVRFNAGSGIVAGPGAIVRGNSVHHNGQLGIHPHGDSVLIDSNEISFNNTRGFDPAWDAGGLKAALVNKLIIRNNFVHHNLGPGLWCDIDCRQVVFDGNTVEYNADAGILYEISSDAVIKNNLLRWDGQGGPGSNGHSWFWGAEIQISASEHVQVSHNSIFVGRDGGSVVLVDQGRRNDSKTATYRTANNTVTGNDIWLDGTGAKTGGVSDVPPSDPNYTVIETGGNSFDGNVYYISPTGCACIFAWGHATYDFHDFQRLGQEKTGRLVEGVAVQP